MRAIATLALLTLGLGTSAQAQSVKLKIQSAWNRSMPVLGEIIRNFESRIEAMEGHGIRLRMLKI